MMAQTDASIQAIGPAISGLPAMKSFASSFRRKKRGKAKKKNLPTSSKAACVPPDLDIVSGFAFLSFSSIEELECHIEDHEVNTQSLKVNVGGKRKKRSQKREKSQNPVGAASANVHSKRIKTPSQKILESYATADLNLNKLRSTVSHEVKRNQIRPFPGSKIASTNSSTYGLNASLNSTNTGDVMERDQSSTSSKINSPAKQTAGSEISLECSETIDICLFDEEAPKEIGYPSSISGIESTPSVIVDTEGIEKKKKRKKRKRDKSINDQTCQTMFRIKKKKKDVEKNTGSSKTLEDKQSESSAAVFLEKEDETLKANFIPTASLTEEVSQSKATGLEPVECENLSSSSVLVQTENSMEETENNPIKVDGEASCNPISKLLLKAPKSQDSKVYRLKISNKVEKIDYCARSGGVSLVEKHHERQNKLKEDEPPEFASDDQQTPAKWENDSQGSNADVNIVVDNLSEKSGNDSSSNSNCGEQEVSMSTKSRIFSGSSSVFISSLDESNDTSDIDIESSEHADSSKPLVNIIKALPKSYLFGHLSTYPDKTTKGTIDVSIQTYENDIQLYMNYAADFKGKIIKIIIPDNEDSKSCFPRSSHPSGLPRFLQPQEYVKAVRSATERNRRHTIGDLFRRLKNEMFEDVRDYYFSKQAILTKAIETIEQSEVDSHSLESEKNVMSFKNQQLRKELNILLFGKVLDDDKLLDLNKVTEYLKTLGIEIEIPPEEHKKDESSQGKAGSKDDSEYDHENSKHVTRKGRPPSEGKLLKPLQSDPQLKLPRLPKPMQLSKYVRAAFNSKMKEFIAIAPSDNSEALSEDQSKPALKTSSSNQEKPTEMNKFVAIAPVDNENEVLSADQGKLAEKDSCSNEETVNISHKSDAMQKDLAQYSSVNKIVCNLTKYRIHQQPRSSGALTIVTNPEPLKGIESKNVVHIKISNDMMKQIGVSEKTPTLRVIDRVSGSSSTTEIRNEVNMQESALTAKPINTIFRPMDGIKDPTIAKETTTKSAFVQCTLQASTPDNGKTTIPSLASSKHKVSIPLKTKKEQMPKVVEGDQLQAKDGETEDTKSPEHSAEESTELLLTERVSCSKEDTASGVAPGGSEDEKNVSKKVCLAIEQSAGTEGLAKGVDGKECAATTGTPKHTMANPQVSVSKTSKTCPQQTLSWNQSTPVVQKHFTTIKPLQGKPLITMAKVQQNKVVPTHVPVTPLDNVSIESTPVTQMKQVVSTKVPQTLKVLPRTTNVTIATKVMPVLKMTHLKPAKFSSQQNVTLLPITSTTMATGSSQRVQMTPSPVMKVVTPQSIAMAPMTTTVTLATYHAQMLQRTPTVTNVLTPQSTTLAAPGMQMVKMMASTGTKMVSPQSIALMPMPTNVTMANKDTPAMQMTEPTASNVTLPHSITVKSSSLGPSPASHYVKIVRAPSPNTVGQKTFIVPNSLLPGTSSSPPPFRIVFKPTGQPKVINSPFSQIKNAIQSSSVMGPPSTKSAPIQQSSIAVTTSVTTHTPVTLNSKLFFQDKVPITNKQVSMQSDVNANSIPVQYKHLIMKAPSLQVVSMPQPQQTKAHVRVQPPPTAPILSSVAPSSGKSALPPTSLSELLLHHSAEDINKPMVGIPLHSSDKSIRQLLVAGSDTQAKVQNSTKPSNSQSLTSATNVFNVPAPKSGLPQNMDSRFASSGNHQQGKGLSEAQVSQLNPKNTSDLASVGSKETFSQIEKILAKIPSPNVTKNITTVTGNTSIFNTPGILRSDIVHPSCSQKSDNNTGTLTQTANENTSGSSTICSRRLQLIADKKSLPQSQMTTASTRDRLSSNQSPNTLETTRPTPVTFSNTCITKATFDDTTPKGDKTCSVVDSPEVVSHMVTADTLSVCNIDSSIPDITSELPSQIYPVPTGYSNQHSLTTKEWTESKDISLDTKKTNTEKKSLSDFELQDESTAEDFDLHVLSTFEWNNDVSNDSNAASPAGHA